MHCMNVCEWVNVKLWQWQHILQMFEEDSLMIRNNSEVEDLSVCLSVLILNTDMKPH